MEAQELHRSRLIDHIKLVVADLPVSRQFYATVFQVLGIPLGGTADDYIWADELLMPTRDSEAAAGALTGWRHLAFQAKDCAMVEEFHKVGLENDGRDNKMPGERKYHPGYYTAFLLDPDGNNMEAVLHGPAKKSADPVVVTF